VYKEFNIIVNPLLKTFNKINVEGLTYKICPDCGLGNYDSNIECVECNGVFYEK